jgi:hypothetical protein
LAVRHAQGRELSESFQLWHASYWRPLEINKEFASHFRQPNAVTRLFRKLVAMIRRRAQSEQRAAARGSSIVAAE